MVSLGWRGNGPIPLSYQPVGLASHAALFWDLCTFENVDNRHVLELVYVWIYIEIECVWMWEGSRCQY